MPRTGEGLANKHCGACEHIMGGKSKGGVHLSVGDVFDDLRLRPGHRGRHKVHSISREAGGIACIGTCLIGALLVVCHMAHADRALAADHIPLSSAWLRRHYLLDKGRFWL